MELKDKCKIAREYLKMTQAEFAQIIKTNQTEISFIERGFIPEDKNKIEKIKTLYNWSNELWNYTK